MRVGSRERQPHAPRRDPHAHRHLQELEDRSHAFVQYEFMRRLRAALLERREEWERVLGEDITDQFLRGASRGGDPWTEYWFCGALGWRIDGWQPLRLRVFTPDAGKLFGGWTADTWNTWTATFQRLLSTCSLTEAQVRRKMYYAGALVNEGTVGAIDVDDQPADRLIPQIVDLHVAFLAEVGLKAN